MIHSTAIVDPGAEMDSLVSVGPYTVIGPHVKVGAGTTIGPHCVIEGHTTIGSDNRIFQFSSLGAIPQDKKYAGEPCELIIGDRNTIREFCTFNIGSPGDTGVTRVGNDNWLMAYQFVRLGAHSMTAMCSLLFADLPPFVMCQGQPVAARSMNFEGLRRRGFSPDRISAVKAMHKALYRDDLTLEQSQARIAELALSHGEATADVELMLSFLKQVSPQRGIVR